VIFSTPCIFITKLCRNRTTITTIKKHTGASKNTAVTQGNKRILKQIQHITQFISLNTWRPSERYCLYKAPRFPKEHCGLEGSQASPVFPWGNSNMYMKMSMDYSWYHTSREEWNYSKKKIVPVPLCPPQIPQGMTRDRTHASLVTGHRPTAWAMAWPLLILRLTLTILKVSARTAQ